MYLGGNQKFASPGEALAHVSEQAWSNWTKADYTLEQWHAACLIHTHDGEATSKSECKLPVKTPDGTLNRNGVHAAAAALAGARGGLKGVSAEQKKKAANALRRYYSQLEEEPPDSLAEHSIDFRVKPGSPGDILEHHGVKGMRWGVRKTEETSNEVVPQGKVVRGAFRSKKNLQEFTGRGGFSPRTETRLALLGPAALADKKVRDEFREADRKVREGKAAARKNEETKSSPPGTPSFQERVQRLTRTDQPQVLKPEQAPKQGLSNEQKALLAFGAVAAAGAGYYAYNKYLGGKSSPFGADAAKLKDLQEIQKLEGMTLPKHWDVSQLKNAPISQQPLGHLAAGEFNAKYENLENLVINTSRGYADILPKDGFDNPFAAAQHASVTRVLEEMRNKYPAVRNLNLEVAPMSAFPTVGSDAHMCVLPMGAGEARLLYNDVMSAPSQATIRANRNFLPGLGKKDYVAYHEMGHLLAVAHGELPPAKEFLSDNPPMKLWKTREVAEPILHRKMFAKHGFTFKELSKLSQYAATEPAEAMAELVGHYLQPEMRQRLTSDQIRRAEAMINEMGGLT